MNTELPTKIRCAFAELRRVRAMIQSVELTLAVGRRLVRIMHAYGFTDEAGARLAFRATLLRGSGGGVP